MINALETPRFFHGDHVKRFLYYADLRVVTAVISANAAGVYIRHIIADRTISDAFLGQGDRFRQVGNFFFVGLKYIICQTLR